MHPDSEYDLSSSCSTASPGGDTPACSQLSPDLLCSASSTDAKKDTVTSAPESFVPTVTAISTSPDLKWMVQPTVIASISPSPRRSKAKAHIISTASSSSKEGGHKATPVNRKGQKDQPSKEDEERRTIRRERNKIAAAKCRNRRRELTDTLQVETDQLEEEKAALQNEIADLLKEKERLEQILSSHEPTCKLPSVRDEDDVEGDRDEDDVEGDHVMQQDPPSSPQLLSLVGGDKSSEGIAALVESPVMQDVDPLPITISTIAILGNSNILLCSSAEEEPLEDLKGDDLDDLVPSLEMVVNDEVATASVPDIDLGGPLCLSDWETLYKSVANDLESLSTPLPSSSPSCSNYRSAFSFNCSEIDSLAEGCETLKGGHGTSEFTKDSLNSPTLLAL